MYAVITTANKDNSFANLVKKPGFYSKRHEKSVFFTKFASLNAKLSIDDLFA